MKRIIIVVAILLAVMGGAAIGAYYFSTNSSAKVVQLYTIELGESFITDIYQSSKLLKADVSFECSDKKLSVKMGEEIDKVRDIVVSTLRNMTEAQMKGFKNEEILKKELVKKVNLEFETTNVTKVYFSNFVIQ